CWYLRQQWREFARAHRKRCYASAREGRGCCGQRNEIEIDASGHHFRQAALTERNMPHIDVGCEPKPLGGHMRGGADSSGSKGQGSRFCLGGCNQVIHLLEATLFG